MTAQEVQKSYPDAQTAGNLNVVVVGWKDTHAMVASVADTAGNFYALAIGPTKGTGLQQSIYFAANISGGVNNMVTVKFDKAATLPDVILLEYAGVAGQGAMDQTIGASGNGALAQCGPVTITAANELIFAATTVVDSEHSAQPGDGFTERMITVSGDLAEDMLTAGFGGSSFSATAPLNMSGNWVMQMVTFRQGAPQRLYPFKGKMQEVALYNRDLSVDAANDLNLDSILGIHAVAAGLFSSTLMWAFRARD